MRLGSCSARVVALIALGALITTGCGAGNKTGSGFKGATSEPSMTSCGISLCDSASTTSPTLATTTPWVAATTNLSGLASECGNMSLVSARPDSDMVVAGVARQGLWASQNGSKTWTRLGQGNGSAVITNRPSSITYDPTQPNRFWESGIYGGGGGLYETEDNGTTFKQLGKLIHTDYVSVDLSDPARRTLLSGRHESSNLYRSGDGGVTWVDISSTLPTGIGSVVAPSAVSARVHLLGTAGPPTAGVLRTTDGGATWSRVYQGGVAGPALIARSDGAIYWLLENGGGLIRSADQGLTWKRILAPGQIASTSASLVELPDGRLASFAVHVIVSADHGRSWKSVGPPLPYTPTGIAYAPFRKSFYAWRFDCSADGSVKPDAIMRFDYDYKTQ